MPEVRSRMEKIIMHMLKIDFQPVRRTRSWTKTIREQRRKLLAVAEDSPSLRHQFQPCADRVYRSAVREAAKQTGLPESTFPLACPCSTDQILYDETWA